MSLKAVFFDLDGTLKNDRDPYHFIHRQLGWGEKTQQLADLYKQGKIDSDEWIRRDVALWQGLSRSYLLGLIRRIPYMPGARETVQTLRARDIITAVISTGLQLHADMVKEELFLNYAVANEVVFENGIATGEVVIHVHESDKASVVRRIMDKENLDMGECLAVGDGESDIGMFQSCRIGIAINPISEEVRQAAHFVIEEMCLDTLLPAVWALVPEWQNT